VYALRVHTVATSRVTHRPWFGDVALVVFLLAQACDGVLTYVGVSTFGPAIEGNPIVGWLMAGLGCGAGVMTAKLVAGLFGVLLHLSDVHNAVAALAGFYLLAAVAPWVALLFVLS
jgi:hypothetical protein